MKLILKHLLYFIGSQDSILPRGVFKSNECPFSTGSACVPISFMLKPR